MKTPVPKLKDDEITELYKKYKGRGGNGDEVASNNLIS